MEPSLCSDGNSEAAEFGSIGVAGFNGAVALQRRKPRAPTAGRRPAPAASMEPSLCSDGNAAALPPPHARALLASMEPSLCSDGNCRRRRWRSCGFSPLQWSRRSAATETTPSIGQPLDAQRASMEPSLCSDGNVQESRGIWAIFALQWSRRSAATETGQVAVEWRGPMDRFNGAVALQRRKPDQPQDRQVQVERASMEPSLCSDGNLGRCRSRVRRR